MAASFDEEIQEGVKEEERRRRERLEAFNQKQINQTVRKKESVEKIKIQGPSEPKQELSGNIEVEEELARAPQTRKIEPHNKNQNSDPENEGHRSASDPENEASEDAITPNVVNPAPKKSSNRYVSREDDEQRRREEFEAYQQQQAQQQYQEEQAARDQQEEEQGQEEEQSGVKNALKQQAVNQIKRQIKKRLIMVVMEFLASTSPVWGTALLVVLLLVVVVSFVVFMPVAAICGNNSYTAAVQAGLPFNMGYAIQGIKGMACPSGTTDQGGGTGGQPSDTPLDIVLTSAYRPDANGSAHQRGEAADISFRVPPTSDNDPRIAQLVALAESFGFIPPVGDTIDEWNNPQENTSAGHVHIEYNLKLRGNLSQGSYCDNVAPAQVPPTDLVNIPSSIPMRGVSRPQLRACMLDDVLAIFEAAQGIEP